MQVLSQVISPRPTQPASPAILRGAELSRGEQSRQPGRWLAAPGNRDYFRGPVNVARVKAWRSRNPGYWRNRRRAHFALQDLSLAQAVDTTDKTV